MIDIEVRKAFDVEMICILLANKMAMVKRGRVTINSTCQAALDAAPRDYSAGFSNLINWTLREDVTLNKVRRGTNITRSGTGTTKVSRRWIGWRALK